MPSYSANFPDEPAPTLKRKRSVEEDTIAPPTNKKLRAMSNIVQSELEAHRRADKYKAKYLAAKTLLKSNGELEDTKAQLEELKTRYAQLKARNTELEEVGRAVHEQTTRDIVEAREAAKEAQREAEKVKCDAQEYVEEVRRDAQAYVEKHVQEVAIQQAQTQTGNDEQYLAYIAQLQAHNDFLTSSLSATASLSELHAQNDHLTSSLSASASQLQAQNDYLTSSLSSVTSSLDAIQAKHTRAVYGFAVHFYIKYPMDWGRIVRNFRPLAEAIIVGNVSEGYRHPEDVRWDIKPERGEQEGEVNTLERAQGGVEEEEEEDEDEEEEDEMEEEQENVRPPRVVYDRARDPRLRKEAERFLDDVAGTLPGFGQQQPNGFGQQQPSGFGASSGFGAPSTSGYGASSGPGFGQQSSPSAFGQPPFAQSTHAQPAPTYPSTSSYYPDSSTSQPYAPPRASAPSPSLFGAGVAGYGAAAFGQPAPTSTSTSYYPSSSTSQPSRASAPSPPGVSSHAAPVAVQRQPTTIAINTSGYDTE